MGKMSNLNIGTHSPDTKSFIHFIVIVLPESWAVDKGNRLEQGFDGTDKKNVLPVGGSCGGSRVDLDGVEVDPDGQSEQCHDEDDGE